MHIIIFLSDIVYLQCQLAVRQYFATQTYKKNLKKTNCCGTVAMIHPCRIHAVFWFGIVLMWFWFPFGLICKKMIFANEGKMIPNRVLFDPMLPTESDFHSEATGLSKAQNQ